LATDPLCVLDWLSSFGQIDWSRAVVDSCSVRAFFWGLQTGPNPTERAKLACCESLRLAPVGWIAERNATTVADQMALVGFEIFMRLFGTVANNSTLSRPGAQLLRH
jgi:hypothetical protein